MAKKKSVQQDANKAAKALIIWGIILLIIAIIAGWALLTVAALFLLILAIVTLISQRRKEKNAIRQKQLEQQTREGEIAAQKAAETRAEYERVHGKNRYSKNTFIPFTNDAACFMKYSYYDVRLMNINEEAIANVSIDELVSLEETADGVTASLNDTVIGCLPHNRIEEMAKKWLKEEGYEVGCFVKSVNEDEKEIQIALAFFCPMTEEELAKINYLDAKLIRTSTKDSYFDTPRKEHIISTKVGEQITLEHPLELGHYVVSNSMGLELGEITKDKSDTLAEWEEEGLNLYGLVTSITENEETEKVNCSVRILAV